MTEFNMKQIKIWQFVKDYGTSELSDRVRIRTPQTGSILQHTSILGGYEGSADNFRKS
jgi:hypothetical protein